MPTAAPKPRGVATTTVEAVTRVGTTTTAELDLRDATTSLADGMMLGLVGRETRGASRARGEKTTADRLRPRFAMPKLGLSFRLACPHLRRRWAAGLA